MDDGQTAVDAIDNEEGKPRNIAVLDHYRTEDEEYDERNGNRPDIACKAAGFFPEVEEAEYQVGDDGNADTAQQDGAGD